MAKKSIGRKPGPGGKKKRSRQGSRQGPAKVQPKALRKRDKLKQELQAERKKKFSDELVFDTILSMCREAGPDDSIRPDDVARALYPEKWQTLLKRVRLFATQLARRGEIFIIRKGQILDPDNDDIKGIIKLSIAPGASSEAPEDHISTA